MPWLRTALVALALLVLTPPLAAVIMVCALFRVKDRPGGPYDWATHTWARGILVAAGVRVRVRGAEQLAASRTTPRVFVSNHVSWFDVFVLASLLPRYAFVAKEELLRIPIFGPAARAAGTVPIDRDNRKSAFASYEEAATHIRGGRSVIVFPEGTRGTSYPLRPFKKGPFVLAIAAGAPIVPTVIYGTLAIMPRRSWLVRGGAVDVQFLEPVPTAGLDYDARDALSNTVHEHMESILSPHLQDACPLSSM